MNSKAKGSSFERKVAKTLSLWLSHGKYDDWVWRTASSGGKATQTPSSKYYHGDLCPVHPDANWLFDYVSIECKNVKRTQLYLFNLFTRSKMPLHKFWQQARRDARKSDRLPALIFHLPNTKFDMVMVREREFIGIIDKFVNVPFIDLPGGLTIVRLDMFLKRVTPEQLHIFLERRKNVRAVFD